MLDKIITPIQENKIAVLEAILCIENEILTEEQLSIKSGVNPADIPVMIDSLNRKYTDNAHGIEIVHNKSGYMLVPSENVWEYIKRHYHKQASESLSDASLETVAVVAYKQPITISQISAIRGVQSSTMVEQLCSKGLIQKVGKKNAPGSPIQYGTTQLFLMQFGLSSLKDLPQLRSEDEKLFELIH